MEEEEKKKIQIRREIQKIRDSMPRNDKESKDKKILNFLFNWNIYQEAKTIFCYVSFRSEINTLDIIKDALTRGKRVCVPKVLPEMNLMKPFLIKDPNKDLKKGFYGILEPDEKCPEVNPEEIDLIIVPGLAFTHEGYRIGYGGGFYDRFLSNSESITCSLAYDFQLYDELPVKDFDIPVDYLITESGIKPTNKRKK